LKIEIKLGSASFSWVSMLSLKMFNLRALHRMAETVDTLFALNAGGSVNNNNGQSDFDQKHSNDALKVSGP
jgi:hypothetical protein